MAAGLPGAGIGGLFYLASTIALPLRSLMRRLAGRPDTIRGRDLALQLGIAAGIIGGIWLAGWLVVLVVPAGTIAGAAGRDAVGGVTAPHSVVRAATIAAGVLTLVVVLASVEVARLLVPARRHAARPAATPHER